MISDIQNRIASLASSIADRKQKTKMNRSNLFASSFLNSQNLAADAAQSERDRGLQQTIQELAGAQAMERQGAADAAAMERQRAQDAAAMDLTKYERGEDMAMLQEQYRLEGEQMASKYGFDKMLLDDGQQAELDQMTAAFENDMALLKANNASEAELQSARMAHEAQLQTLAQEWQSGENQLDRDLEMRLKEFDRETQAQLLQAEAEIRERLIGVQASADMGLATLQGEIDKAVTESAIAAQYGEDSPQLAWLREQLYAELAGAKERAEISAGPARASTPSEAYLDILFESAVGQSYAKDPNGFPVFGEMSEKEREQLRNTFKSSLETRYDDEAFRAKLLNMLDAAMQRSVEDTPEDIPAEKDNVFFNTVGKSVATAINPFAPGNPINQVGQFLGNLWDNRKKEEEPRMVGDLPIANFSGAQRPSIGENGQLVVDADELRALDQNNTVTARETPIMRAINEYLGEGEVVVGGKSLLTLRDELQKSGDHPDIEALEEWFRKYMTGN